MGKAQLSAGCGIFFASGSAGGPKAGEGAAGRVSAGFGCKTEKPTGYKRTHTKKTVHIIETASGVAGMQQKAAGGKCRFCGENRSREHKKPTKKPENEKIVHRCNDFAVAFCSALWYASNVPFRRQAGRRRTGEKRSYFFDLRLADANRAEEEGSCGDGVICCAGSSDSDVCLRMQCSVGIAHMPESGALFTLLI